MNKNKKLRLYMTGLIAAGSMCFLYALINLPFSTIDLYLVLLAILTLGVGTRITLQIPRLKSHISVSDTFIFLALLLYGVEVAITLAAVEAFLSSWRFCKRTVTVLTNAAVMAICTFIVAYSLSWSGYLAEAQAAPVTKDWNDLIIALSLLALAQFLTNTAFAAVYAALKGGKPIFETWKNNFLGTFLTYAVGAASAAILFLLDHTVGYGVVIAAFPVMLLVYLSYRMYLEKMELSLSQAEQAKKHAKVLEEQSNALRESEERFRSAFNFAPIGIALVSSTGRWLKVNKALCDILGYSVDEFLESDFQSMTFADDLGDTLVKMHELLSGKSQACQLEQRYLHKNGEIVWTSWNVSLVRNINSDNPHLIFQFQDITEKKAAEEKLRFEATHDSLTHLPNRSLFMTRLEQAVETARRNPSFNVSVLFIDLDRFKLVNDSLGHMAGDKLLVSIAARLKDCLRPADLVARLGGDEFVILVEGKSEQDEVVKIAERVQQKFSAPFDLDGSEVYSSASIGILQLTEKHQSAEEMMRDADTAMYQAKRAGKARHEIFDPQMHEVAKQALQVETDIRRAVENGEFTVFYQPIYSIVSEETIGFEALARWKHKILGYIPPNDFIPVAEELGIIDALGEQIMRTACREIKSLIDANPDAEPLILSVNVSCKQFNSPKLVETVKEILEETRFPARRLKLEITESVFLEHRENAIKMLKQLKDLGIEIDVDDFGTGYSNLNYLTQLPISTLKIDRSFIDTIDRENNNLEIVQTIIALARSLGLKVIAEGVENEEQLDKLKMLNCEGAQGFYFARPMSFERVKQFIADPTAKPRDSFEDLPLTPSVQ